MGAGSFEGGGSGECWVGPGSQMSACMDGFRHAACVLPAVEAQQSVPEFSLAAPGRLGSAGGGCGAAGAAGGDAERAAATKPAGNRAIHMLVSGRRRGREEVRWSRGTTKLLAQRTLACGLAAHWAAAVHRDTLCWHRRAVWDAALRCAGAAVEEATLPWTKTGSRQDGNKRSKCM